MEFLGIVELIVGIVLSLEAWEMLTAGAGAACTCVGARCACDD